MFLSFLALAFPAIDPVIFSIGAVAVRWYSLAYIAGIVGGWWYVSKLDKRAATIAGLQQVLGKQRLDDVVSWIILGVIIGGRLGYVLFYQPAYYLKNPLQIFYLWEGGMSFHGGFLGVLIATWLFCRKHDCGFFRVMDLFACATPIGLFFGRLANFINGELYGRPSDVAWAVMFPHGGFVPRHPSQLYEAGLEGLLLGAVLAWLAWRTQALRYPSLISGIFLLGYGLSRTVVETVREPDVQLGFLLGDWLTMGMLLSLPMVLVGGGMAYAAYKRA